MNIFICGIFTDVYQYFCFLILQNFCSSDAIKCLLKWIAVSVMNLQMCITYFFLSFVFKRLVNDSNFGWRGLRLLANRSPHFFTHSASPIATLPEYLTTMIKKLAKELPVRIIVYSILLLITISKVFWSV